MDQEMEQALQSYIEEASELLQEMEDGLLSLEADPEDRDRINAIFRAAHTIKGSAGLFGLDFIVSFTHVVESVLDRLRNGDISVTSDLANLLLGCGDHIKALIGILVIGGREADPDTRAAGDGLLHSLQNYLDITAKPAEGEPPVVAPQPEAGMQAGGGVAGTDNWHISLRFGSNVLRNGMDPLSFIRYLGTLGEIVTLTTLPIHMPALEEMDAESCYLGFEINYKTESDKESIESVFEFVRDDCVIHILPPHSKLAEYAEMIRRLPEGDSRLGEILVASGALTRKELESALQLQRSQSEHSKTGDAGQADAPAGSLGQILVKSKVIPEELVQVALTKQSASREAKARESQHVRVRADKLDQLINLVGELVIAGASTSLLARKSGDRGMHEACSTMSRLVEEIRDNALQLRMVPIGETFNRFQRVVRDVSRELGKDIDLVINGGETELDKTVVEKIGDPLTHLVRNAMDHGIEPVDVRIANGKPEKGAVRLNAYHDSGSVVIEISDDGGGLKRDKILHKAIEKGMVAPGQTPTDQELYNLVFEAGFSTAEQVTNLSGRGVGMDVVKRNIMALRGTVNLESDEGLGTTVRIRLPLTLAIIDGFLVGVGKSAYVIPLDMVVECIELSEQDRAVAALQSYLNLRGEVLPCVRLREQFDITDNAGKRENVVVVQYGGKKTGLVVDTLMGEFQTVIKPLGKMFSLLKGISGSTILGSGDVALIISVPDLVQQVADKESGLLSAQARRRGVLAVHE